MTTAVSPASAPPAPKSNAGLEGVVAAPSDICYIDGVAGRLVYRGYEIGDLVENATFEEVAYLLWEGRLPDVAELKQLKADLVDSALPPHTTGLLRLLPKE